MSDIRDDIRADFEYLNKRAVKYDMALKMMESDHLPACFKPALEHRQLLMIHTAIKGTLLWMQDALKAEEE